MMRSSPFRVTVSPSRSVHERVYKVSPVIGDEVLPPMGDCRTVTISGDLGGAPALDLMAELARAGAYGGGAWSVRSQMPRHSCSVRCVPGSQSATQFAIVLWRTRSRTVGRTSLFLG